MSLPTELERVLADTDANTRDALAIVEGLDETTGAWRPAPGSWSVAECLDHLAVSNRVYLVPMIAAADRARARGRMRRGAALPGLLGGWFVRSLQPPVKHRTRNPPISTPRQSPPLADSLAAFLASQNDFRAFVRGAADLDLAGVRFANPFVRAIRWSLATGLHVIPAHERRHLWQARNVRTAALQG
jgi:hypothetical protein